MRAGPIDVREAYATFNMGVGFAVYVDPKDVEACLRVAKETRYDAWVGGTVEKRGSRKAVEIEPLAITFEGETLKVR
jgi:phosphoribosylformylglycinamidine cyclo-ligase